MNETEIDPMVRKIICRYKDGPPSKHVLRDGESALLLLEIERLAAALSHAYHGGVKVKALEEAAKVADDAAEGTDGLTDGEIWIAGRIATAIRALVKP